MLWTDTKRIGEVTRTQTQEGKQYIRGSVFKTRMIKGVLDNKTPIVYLELTCKDCGHERCEHQEQHTEEETAGIIECLTGLISYPQVQEANQYPNTQVRNQPQSCQGLQVGLHNGFTDHGTTPINTVTETRDLLYPFSF